MQHLVNIEALSAQQISNILAQAQDYLLTVVKQDRVLDKLQGKVIANLFFESSTRTVNSFEIAAKRLGSIVVTPQMSYSSTNKSESLVDTVLTMAAMGADFCIIRHSQDGIVQAIADEIGNSTHIINAGDGQHQHPTQALIDLLTIQQHHPSWPHLQFALIGDILHSRVARSLVQALNKMGVKNIRLIAPSFLQDHTLNQLENVSVFDSVETGLIDVDVIMALRLQKERMSESSKLQLADFFEQYGLTKRRLQLAKNNAIVLHPGPINRAVEICPEVAYSQQSRILDQVCNGVAIRMAVINFLHQSQ